MGVMKKLGSNLSFLELEVGSRVSRSTHAWFFHSFVDKFVHERFHAVIGAPTTASEWAECLLPYAHLGLPGAVASLDCTHVQACVSV